MSTATIETPHATTGTRTGTDTLRPGLTLDALAHLCAEELGAVVKRLPTSNPGHLSSAARSVGGVVGVRQAG